MVLAIIAILAGLLLPALNSARERARATTCVNQVKQLTLGMVAYLQDNRERYPDVLGTGEAGRRGGWNYFDSRPAEDILVGDISKGVLYPYVNNAKIFVCPSVLNGTNCSYAMSNYLENRTNAFMRDPRLLMFLEEARPNATNDGCYVPGTDPVTTVHSGNAVFSAIDGRVFTEKWDINTIKSHCQQ